jgi:mono/diheme cytochrome c family protein
MNKYRVHIVLVACFVALAAYGCKHAPQEVAKTPENTFTVKGSVREMDLNPSPPPAFPEHEGKTEFMSYCAICHSLKYISSQPDFPQKTWEAEVTKMVAKYHAPIDSVTAKKIVAYLVAVKSNH